MSAGLRTRVLAGLLVCAWGVLVARAAQVQLFQHERWQAEADRIRQGVETIPGRRGEIRARDGQVLASSVLNWSLGVDPSLVTNPDELAAALDSLRLISPRQLRSLLARHRDDRFCWISRRIVPETPVDRLLRRFGCLIVQTEGKRLYPAGRAGGSVVGLLGRDELALGGLEAAFDERLKAEEGRLLRVSDATRSRFRGFDVKVLEEPVPGMDVEVTLDPRLQEIASARLAEAVRREGATAGMCILTRPQTGEILAMASVPGPDPEDPSTWNSNTLRVRPVTDALEPGSSFKLVAFAACLEAGVLNRNDPIDCMDGRRPVPGGRPITDHEPYGVLKAWEVLAHSSNIGAGVLAERVGAERFYRMEKALGFGLPTGVPLPGEGRGRIPEPSGPAWSARSLVTMAFGQEVSCTALQMAMAYGAVANGGNLMRPLLVRAVRARDGSVAERWDPEVIRPALRPAVARELRSLLRAVVTDGTGKKAEIPGYEPAGKTSTAQKYIPEEGSYSTRRYIAAFVGFAPWEDPQVLCLVLLDEPSSNIYGGNVAAPLFREIVSDAIPFIEAGRAVAGTEPVRWVARERDQRREIPSVGGLSAALAGRLVREAGFLPRLLGEGDRVLATTPSAGERALPGTVVSLVLDEGGRDSTGGASPMPDLRGLSLRDALLRVRSLDARAEVTGSGWVLEQRPETGDDVRPGEVCRIRLGADSCRSWKEWLEGERQEAWADARGGGAGRSAR